MAAPTYNPGTGAAASMAAMTGHGDGAVDHLARAGTDSAHARLDDHDARLSKLESDAGPALDADDDTGTTDSDS